MISIIIPTYNEIDNIIKLILEIKKYLNKSNLKHEIIIVDDNSTDGTNQSVKLKFINDKNVRLFVRKNKRELGTAILHGIKKSKGSVIIGMDADFNHQPKEIIRLIKEVKINNLVIASRFVKGGGMEQKFKHITSYIFNFFLRYALKFPIMDNTSGFYAIKKTILSKLPFEYIYSGYGEYHMKLVYLASKSNINLIEIPVFFPKRKFGQSKSNLLIMFIKYLWVGLTTVFQKNI